MFSVSVKKVTQLILNILRHGIAYYTETALTGLINAVLFLELKLLFFVTLKIDCN